MTAATLVNDMARAVLRIREALGRFPTDAEAQMLWAEVQRFHGIPEDQIEPSTQRRWH